MSIGFRVEGFGLQAWGFGLRVWGSGSFDAGLELTWKNHASPGLYRGDVGNTGVYRVIETNMETTILV